MPKAGAIWPARPCGVVGHHDEADQRVELEVGEAVARRLLHPADLRAGPLRRGVGRRLGAAGALAQVDVDADDVGVAGGEGEHALAAAADDQRRAGLLHRPRRQRVAQHLVVLAVEVERPVGAQQSLDHLHRLLEARHPRRRGGRRPARPRRSPCASSRRRGSFRSGRRSARRASPPPWPARRGGGSRCRRPASPCAAWWWRPPPRPGRAPGRAGRRSGRA